MKHIELYNEGLFNSPSNILKKVIKSLSSPKILGISQSSGSDKLKKEWKLDLDFSDWDDSGDPKIKKLINNVYLVISNGLPQGAPGYLKTWGRQPNDRLFLFTEVEFKNHTDEWNLSPLKSKIVYIDIKNKQDVIEFINTNISNLNNSLNSIKDKLNNIELNKKVKDQQMGLLKSKKEKINKLISIQDELTDYFIDIENMSKFSDGKKLKIKQRRASINKIPPLPGVLPCIKFTYCIKSLIYPQIEQEYTRDMSVSLNINDEYSLFNQALITARKRLLKDYPDLLITVKLYKSRGYVNIILHY